MNNDIGSVDAPLRSKRGEKNGVRARQYLWPSMRNVRLAQRRHGLWLATRSWHAQQRRPRLLTRVEDNGTVVTPRGAARVNAVGVADNHGGATRDRNLLQFSVREAEESNPLAIGRKERVADRSLDQRHGS